MSVKVAFYGSLREGLYNYNYFSKNAKLFKKIKTELINGFEMYSLGAYPVIVPTNDKKEKIKVEFFEIDQDTYKSIRSMELGAGYLEKTLEDGSIIYYMPQVPSRGLTKVYSGDWFDYA